MNNEKVAILMSTYNGERFLKTQIDSILNQSFKNFHLFIRDDGSTDNTLKILSQFETNPNVTIYFEENNLGYKNSFLQLLRLAINSEDNFAYYAFSDQDDFWEREKIKASVLKLQSDNSLYRLYFSGLTFVDENLNLLKDKDASKVKTTFAAEIVRHSISGATAVFSTALAELAIQYDEVFNLPGGHDAFIFRLNAAVGGYFFADQANYIMFRRHDDNTSSASKDVLTKIKNELNSTSHSELQTAKFLKKYYEYLLAEDILKEIDLLINYNKGIKYKLELCKNKNFRRENNLMNILFIYKVIFNKL